MRRTKTTPPRIPTRTRKPAAHVDRGLLLFIDNRVGRAGVPTRRSFETWLTAALRGRRRGQTELNICLAEPTFARTINKQFRGKDYATNVLSFPYRPEPFERASRLLGDLVICHAVVLREAAEQGKTVRAHYAHMTVHGVLHLLGYDHELGEREAIEMEAIERQVLDSLGFADPYA